MLYAETAKDLFEAADDRLLIQCISADFACDTGICIAFDNKFGIKHTLLELYGGAYLDSWFSLHKQGDCLRTGNVFNLVTRAKSHGSATEVCIRNSLLILKGMCREQNVTRLALTNLGMGLERVGWEKVREIIKDVFKDTDVDILVCTCRERRQKFDRKEQTLKKHWGRFRPGIKQAE